MLGIDFPEGRVLIHSCSPFQLTTVLPDPASSSIVNFTDNSCRSYPHDDERRYREMVDQLATRCSDHNLSLNVERTK